MIAVHCTGFLNVLTVLFYRLKCLRCGQRTFDCVCVSRQALGLFEFARKESIWTYFCFISYDRCSWRGKRKKKNPVILFPLSKPYYYQQYMNINTKTKWMFTFALFFCFFFATRFDGRHCCGRMHCKKKLIQTDRPYAAP